MSNNQNTSRRGILKAGIAAAAATVVSTPAVFAAKPAFMPDYTKFKKAPGEIKVVYLGGDQLHCGFTQREMLQSVYGKTNWKIYYMEDARYLTPEMISDADLLLITRWGGGISAWKPEPIINVRESENDEYMTDEQEAAIIDNVKNRGMGFMALHCTCWYPDRPKLMELFGIKPIMHGAIQTVFFYNINHDHPITKGIQEFDISLDENFGVELPNPNAVKLFNSFGMQDKRKDIAAWALEQGKGRIVGLLAGHTHDPWRHPVYQELYWRAAHWTMKKDIPKFQAG
jgi:type 1 glutamine amidotransferase